MMPRQIKVEVIGLKIKTTVGRRESWSEVIYNSRAVAVSAASALAADLASNLDVVFVEK